MGKGPVVMNYKQFSGIYHYIWDEATFEGNLLCVDFDIYFHYKHFNGDEVTPPSEDVYIDDVICTCVTSEKHERKPLFNEAEYWEDTLMNRWCNDHSFYENLCEDMCRMVKNNAD